MTLKTTHIVTLIDKTKSHYTDGVIVKSSACANITYAQNLAKNWMMESTNLNHAVYISSVIETHQLETFVKVTTTGETA